MADEKLPQVVLQPATPQRSCSRRQLVRGAALAACAPALGGLVGCARRIAPARDVDVGAPVDGRLVLASGDVKELGRAGGAVVVHNPCINPVLVVNTGSGILAMGAVCPHASCEVAWVEEDRQAECPCHGSRFAGDGTVLSGPAVTDLASYPATVDASGAIVISLLTGDNVFPPLSGGVLTIDLSDRKYGALQTPGGAVVGQPNGSRFPIAVTRPNNPPITAQQGLLVLNGLCTHLTCSVQPLPGTGLLHCPCHGSEFTLEGAVFKGPAVDPLPPLSFTVQGNTLTVQIGPTC